MLFVLSRRSPAADRLPFVVPEGLGKAVIQLFLLSALGLVPARNRPWALTALGGLLTVVMFNAALPRRFPIESELATVTGRVTAVAMADRALVFRVESSPLVFRYARWWPACPVGLGPPGSSREGLVQPGRAQSIPGALACRGGQQSRGTIRSVRSRPPGEQSRGLCSCRLERRVDDGRPPPCSAAAAGRKSNGRSGTAPAFLHIGRRQREP